MEKEEMEQKMSDSSQYIESLINQISKLRKENKDLKTLIKDILNGKYTETELRKLRDRIDSRW